MVPEAFAHLQHFLTCTNSLPYLCPPNFRNMFNKRVKIKELLSWEPQQQEVTVMGWVRTFRNNQFIALNDGSTNNNLQVVAELGKV